MQESIRFKSFKFVEMKSGRNAIVTSATRKRLEMNYDADVRLRNLVISET